MLLVEFTIDTVLIRVSDRLLTLEHTWYPYIDSFSSPQWQTATDYGGFVRLGFGDITLTPKPFENSYPPPLQCNAVIKYTATNEAAAITLFDTTAHLTSYDKSSVIYKLRDIEYEKDLLEEKDDYNENSVAIGKAFGTVTHITPTQLPDVDIGGGYGNAPTYDLHGVGSSSVAFSVIGFSSVSGGTQTEITIGDANGDLLNHGYSNGDTVYIGGSDNFDVAHVISNASGAVFTIPIAFSEESLPLYVHAYEAGDVQVFDDGVPISTNFHGNGDGTFSLTAVPVGQVTISGTASQTTLDEILNWGQGQLGIGSYSNTYARSPSPAVNCFITSQTTIIDFLSNVSAAFSHLFYIKNNVLNIVDMYIDNGSETLTNFEFFESPKYGKFAPVKELKSSWNTYSAETGNSGGEHDLTVSHYIKTTEHEISEDLYEYGNEMSVTAFHDNEANVRTCIVNIREIYKKDTVSLSIPVSGSLPVPGKKLSWTDSMLIVDVPGYIRTRILSFDFFNGQVMITGEGEFLRPAIASMMYNVTIASASTETVDSLNHDLAKSVVWDYVVTDSTGTNMRMGRISAVWDQVSGSTPEIFAHWMSEDMGTTIGIVTFDVVKVADVVHLKCTTTSGSWTITGSHKRIG